MIVMFYSRRRAGAHSYFFVAGIITTFRRPLFRASQGGSAKPEEVWSFVHSGEIRARVLSLRIFEEPCRGDGTMDRLSGLYAG